MTTLVLRAIALLAGLLSLLAAQSVHAALPPAMRVAVFDDPGFVDTSSLTPGAESDNVQAALSSFGHVVAPFTGTTEAAWRVATANADVVIVPELEIADLAAALDENAEQALVDFAGGGGTVIVMGNSSRAVSLLNAVFGFTATNQTGSVATLAPVASAATRFAFGPSSLPLNNGTSAISGLTSIYIAGSPTSATVARAAFGAGEVIFLGWDWFDAAPIGAQDGGWNEVLRRAVLEGRPPQRRVAVYADAAYVDVSSPAPDAEARNVQAALVQDDALVTLTSGTDFQAFGAPRRPDVDALVIPELDADLGAAMPDGARTRVRDFVGAGGTLIVHGGSGANANPAAFLNAVFGFATFPQAVAPGAQSERTPFARVYPGLYGSGPATLTHFSDSSGLGGLPVGARAIYESGSAATVVVIPHGEGFIHFLGWDWLQGAPLGPNDGGWRTVLDLAMRSARSGRRVALFANETFVDAIESPAQGTVSAEGVALSATLVSQGHVPTWFTETDRAGWGRALARADVVAIPELEKLANLASALDAPTEADLVGFVRRGGLLVMSMDGNGNAVSFLNGVFGFSLTTASPGGASTLGAVFGTPFETAPPTLPQSNAVFAVNGGQAIYSAPGGTTVAWLPVGAGHVLLLGWDFYDAQAAGGAQSGAGWPSVLDLALESARRRPRHVAVFGDETYVETTSPAASPEAETVHQALTLFDHSVSEVLGPTAGELRSALGGVDALLVPKQHVAALAPDLTSETRGILRDFVASGGALIVNGDIGDRASGLLNGVFGWSVVQQAASGSALGGFLPGTRFDGGPGVLSGTQVAELVFASLPPGSRIVYADDGPEPAAIVAEIPYGRGRVIYLGWTFTGFPSLGALNLPWLDVLDRAVQETPLRSRRVAVYADGAYVDSSQFGEVRVVDATLEALGQTRSYFYETGYEFEWSNAFAPSQVVFLPELEGADLAAALAPTSPLPQHLRNFVARGGTFAIAMDQAGNGANFLNRIFGYSLAAQFSGAPGGFPSTQALDETPFATGPATLPNMDATTVVSGLPAGATSLYQNADGSAVALIPYGAGQIAVFGWDFFGATPWAQSDVGQAAWRDVLRRVLDLSPPNARHVAVFDDPGVVDTSDVPTAESDNVQAALLEKQHAVVPFRGTSLADWSAALSRADTVLVPEQEVAALAPLLDDATRNALRGFVEAGGGLVVQGNGAAELVNALYGTALALDPSTDAQSHRQSPAEFGTAFSGGPTPLGALAYGKGWLATSLPGDARAIYRTSDTGNPVTLVWLPRGYGRVVMTGFPWYDVIPYGSTDDGGWNDVLDRAVREGMGGDADDDGVAGGDVCPLVVDDAQLDADADGVGDACDNCIAVANARMAPSDVSYFGINGWATLTGGQRDDDHDGYGNRCDAKFPFTAGALVGAPDLVQLRASLGQSRLLDTCGSAGNLPCAIFDLDESVTTVSAGDVSRFRALLGKTPGPRCTTCPLPCSAGANGSCEELPHP